MGGMEANKQRRITLRPRCSAEEGSGFGDRQTRASGSPHGVFCIVTCISGAQALADSPYRQSSLLESRLARVKILALVVGSMEDDVDHSHHM